MRPPNANAPAPPIPVRRLVFRLGFRYVPISSAAGGYIRIGAALVLSPLGRRLLMNFVLTLFTIFRRHRRIRNEKVDGAPLELGLRREYEKAADHAFGAGFAQDVVRVVFEDLAGCDRAGYFFYVAVYVDYSDHV